MGVTVISIVVFECASARVAIAMLSTETCTDYERHSSSTHTHTVEVGSLHTLRLESLKLLFQPLHKFLVHNL